VGQYHVRAGHTVYVNDSTIFPSPSEEANLAQDELYRRDTEVRLRLFTTNVDSMLHVESSHLSQKGFDISLSGFTARFGANLSSYITLDLKETPLLRTPEGVAVRRHPGNLHGCDPYKGDYPDSMLVVRRGHCTFLEKLLRARDASAAGIVIISDEEAGINPTANPDELAVAGDLNDVAVILLPKKIGETFQELLIASEQFNSLQIMIALQQAPGDSDESDYAPIEREEQPKDPNRILYINGHPLINTRLLV
jgi:mannosidase alpha-like ER degradation enhancer 1